MEFIPKLPSMIFEPYRPDQDPVDSFKILNGRLHVKMKSGMDFIIPAPTLRDHRP